jgi:hypothetical protein
MDCLVRTTPRGATFLTSWVGLGLILLAAALNLTAAVTAAYARDTEVAKLLIKYEQKKPTLTLALVAGGLVLVLRDALVHLSPSRPRQAPAPAQCSTFTLTPTSGREPLVSSRYLETSQAAGPAGSHGRLAV